jgi:hypothetical protein
MLDAHRALELLEDYCARLTSPSDKQLRIAIEKVIYIFKSSLFQALLDIQEFYEAILLDENKDNSSKALAVLRIADKWLENAPLPTGAQVQTEYRNGLMVQSSGNNSNSGQDMMHKKSPSFLSNKSDNMSVDGGGAGSGIHSILPLPLTQTVTIPDYADHWTYEKIILERVSEKRMA